MSIKKAQKIQRQIDEAVGVDIATFQTSDLHFLKEKLEAFLDLGIDTEDLTPADDAEEAFLDEPEDMEEDYV